MGHTSGRLSVDREYLFCFGAHMQVCTSFSLLFHLLAVATFLRGEAADLFFLDVDCTLLSANSLLPKPLGTRGT